MVMLWNLKHFESKKSIKSVLYSSKKGKGKGVIYCHLSIYAQ